ncbi:unnamed protein product [Prunus armeniaca]
MEEPLLDTAAGADQLSTKPHDLYEGGNEDYAPVRSFDALRCMFWTETVKLWKMAGPAVITMLCMYGTNSAVVLFVGHLGTVELSAVSISLSVISTFAYGFLFGMGSALETLCGQAFGAGEIHMLGIYMQRSWIILLVTSLFILPIYIFATPVLKLLGQEDDIANLAGEFTIQTIPSLFSLAIIFPSQKFLQAQRKVKVLAWIAVLGLLIQIGMLCLFLLVFGWGTLGAAVAFDIVRWGMAIAQVVYIMGWCRDGWTGFSWLAFKEIWAFVRLSLASAVMLCLEIWYMMSILILTGHLDNAVIAVGSLSICMNFNGFELMLFVGINVAISVRVSNELGSGRPRAAKYSVYVTVFQCLLIGIFFMIVILITKDSFSLLFTSDKELQQAVAKLAYLLGITMLLNSIQPIISGVAIGGGWQALVAYINLGSYYIFGLPLGYLLGYTANLGVMGLWGGMICGTALQTLLLLIVLYKTNWNKEVEQATKRVRKWGGQDVTAENGAQSKGEAEAADDDYAAVRSFEEAMWVSWKEAAMLWRIAAPVAFTTLFQYLVLSVTTVFVGHLGDLELSAISLSVTVISGIPFGLLQGMATALGTLCGQAYGAGQVGSLGIYMQRSWIVLLITCIILSPVYIFAAPILEILGQESDIADLAGKYSVKIIPQLFSSAIFFPTQRFLQAQSKVSAMALIAFVALIVQTGLLHLFINVFGWGTTGAAVAYDITHWGITVGQFVYIMVWCNEEWTGFSWLAFKDIWAFAKLSLASCMMFCLDSWYTMTINILAGLLENAVIAVGSFSICMNFQNWEIMLLVGLNAAISTRVSNELGMGRPRAAKYAVCTAVLQSLIVGILSLIAVFISRDYFAMVFTNSEDMQRAVARLAYFLGVTMLLNSATVVLSGVAVGGGWQVMVAYINFACYYLFGLPLAIFLGFKANLGALGLWGGMMSGSALQILFLLIVTSRTNWDREVEQTTKRINNWGSQ